MVARKSIDVSGNEELRRIAEEVERTGEPRDLTLNGREIAVISPAKRGRKPRLPTASEYQRFLSSAGSWAGLIDVEDFKRASRESRSITKPAPEL